MPPEPAIDNLPEGERFILHALGRIEANQQLYREELKEFKAFVTREIDSLKDRVTAQERAADEERGWRKGIKFAIDVAKTLPVGVLGIILGKGDVI